MKEAARQKAVILGCGNVAWHIASHLASLKTFKITVYNHQANPLLSEFKLKLKCAIQAGFHHITSDADYYIICVADNFIKETASKINNSKVNSLVLHTSGSSKITLLGKRVFGTGVMYPLQTFSRTDQVNWKNIPLLLETDDECTGRLLKSFAALFSNKILQLNYTDRLQLHLAAVVVNNFTNALYAAADQLLSATGTEKSFSLLLPLIEKTTEKIHLMSPIEAQTGPAKRNDTVAMEKHLELLRKNKDLRKVYKQMSALIHIQQKGLKNEL